MLTDVHNRLNYYGLVTIRGDTIQKSHKFG